MNKLTSVFFHWLPIGISVVGICGLSNLLIQQSYRSGLNDPQIEMVRNAAVALSTGVQLEHVVSLNQIDLTTSYSPFLAVYDKERNELVSSATVSGESAVPPIGVFEYAKKHGRNEVTWQPNKETRVALVMEYVPDADQFVAAGRNIVEVEDRIARMNQLSVLGTLFILVVTFAADAYCDAWRRKKMSR